MKTFTEDVVDLDDNYSSESQNYSFILALSGDYEDYVNHNTSRDWHRLLGHLSSNGIKHLHLLGSIPIKQTYLKVY